VKDNCKAVIDAIKSMVMDVDVDIDEAGKLCVENTYDIFEIDQVFDLITKIFDVAGFIDMDISGYIDASESAGEYMDFCGNFVGGHGDLKYSDWYVYCYPYDYMDATDEDFEDAENSLFYPIARSEIEAFLKYVEDTGDDEPRVVIGTDKVLYKEPVLRNTWTI
jgi:hypothetical protein